MSPHFRSIALIFLACCPASTLACTAADDLAQVHSDYAALLAGRPAAAVDSGPVNPLDLVRRLGQEGSPVDVSEMAEVAADLALLAETARSGDVTEMSAATFSRHVRNLESLQSWITATGCETRFTPLETTRSRQIADTGATAGATTDTPRPPDGDTPRLAPIAFLLLLLAGLGLAAFVFRRDLFRLSGFRGRRKEQRVPVSLDAELVLEGHDSPIAARAVDLSHGGTKLATDIRLPEKTRLQVTLKDETHAATVVWSNNYYAGLSFSPPLSDEAFHKLRDS